MATESSENMKQLYKGCIDNVPGKDRRISSNHTSTSVHQWRRYRLVPHVRNNNFGTRHGRRHSSVLIKISQQGFPQLWRTHGIMLQLIRRHTTAITNPRYNRHTEPGVIKMCIRLVAVPSSAAAASDGGRMIANTCA